MLANVENATVALHSCRKINTAWLPSGEMVELKVALWQLENCSEAYQITAPINKMPEHRSMAPAIALQTYGNLK